MPLKKIKEDKPCMSNEHEPPRNFVYEPGEYVYSCPVCGKETKFLVPLIT